MAAKSVYEQVPALNMQFVHDQPDLLTLRTQVNLAGDPVMEAPEQEDLRELVSADWADGRLVLARQQYIEEDITQDLDLLLSIYDENGSRSTMVSRCSVGREITPERDKRTLGFPAAPRMGAAGDGSIRAVKRF